LTLAWQPRSSAGLEEQGLAERGQGCLDSVFIVSRPWPWGSPVVKHSNLLSEQKLFKALVAEV